MTVSYTHLARIHPAASEQIFFVKLQSCVCHQIGYIGHTATFGRVGNSCILFILTHISQILVSGVHIAIELSLIHI